MAEMEIFQARRVLFFGILEKNVFEREFMKQTIEKISILSLSLMLVSTFAVSPALPQMVTYFAGQGISVSQLEFLMTVTSLAIMVSLLANSLLVRFLSERVIIILGLILLAIGGALPALVPVYAIMFLARILLGLGIGMINARAINLIGILYTGRERTHLLGLRGSAEVLGSATLTIIVGWLLAFGWQAAFLVYLFAFVILFLFLAFVPKEHTVAKTNTETAEKLTPALWKIGVIYAFLAFFVINVNTFLTIRIPLIVTSNALGTATQASWILSLMQLMGIVAGTVFAAMLGKMKGWLLPLSYTVFGCAVVMIALSSNIWLLSLGAMVSGFFYSIVLNVVFSQVTERTPKNLLNSVMTITLIGCNIGGATASILPNFLEAINPTSTGAFGVYAVLTFVIALGLIVKEKRK